MQTTPRQGWLSFLSLSFCLQVYFTSRATQNLNTPTDLAHVYKNRTVVYWLHWCLSKSTLKQDSHSGAGPGEPIHIHYVPQSRAAVSRFVFFWVFEFNGFDWKGLKGLSGSVLRIFANIGLEQHYIILLSTNLTLRLLNQLPHPNLWICFLLLIIYLSLTPAY